jgi:AcrR family transcriptional regulator
MTVRSVNIKYRLTMPKTVDKPLKRQQIARTAMPLVARDGFENTPIRKIAARAGMGKGTFYDYFSSKEDILTEIVQLMFADWTDLMIAKIGPLDDPLQQLDTLLKEGSALGERFEQMMILYVDIWRWSVRHRGATDIIDRFQAFLADSKMTVAGIIERAKRRGLIAGTTDSEGLAIALIALIDGMCLHRMILKENMATDAVCQTFLDSILEGIKPP